MYNESVKRTAGIIIILFIVGAAIGVLILMVANLLISFFVDGGLGLRSGGPLAIIFSLVCIGIGAFMLLRKRALMGDALSRATLPGIGLAFRKHAYVKRGVFASAFIRPPGTALDDTSRPLPHVSFIEAHPHADEEHGETAEHRDLDVAGPQRLAQDSPREGTVGGRTGPSRRRRRLGYRR